MRSTVAAVALCFFAVAAEAATFTVSNNADLGPGSLRQAIADANATAGLDTIDFSIGTGAQTIVVNSTLTVTSPLTIDGATQEGFSGTPLIRLQGTFAGDGLAFAAGADGSAVRNLEIGGFIGAAEVASIAITGAANVTVAGNYLGAVLAAGRESNTGVRVLTSNNTIGGLTSADRNVFANDAFDVLLMNTATANTVLGNYFGFDPTGLVMTFPAERAITIRGSNNVIGGTDPGARNVVISGLVSVYLTEGAQNNRVQGNYIGLNANGTGQDVVPRSNTGISVDGGPGNLIGGTVAAARNVVGRHVFGIHLSKGGNLVQGNFLGTDPTGLAAAGNEIGIGSDFTSEVVVIGGTAAGAGNLISGNERDGVHLGTPRAVLQGNYIGTDVTGLAALPNMEGGVLITGEGGLIGGDLPGSRNVISGNLASGIYASDINSVPGDGIIGNYIGVGADGVTPVPNGGSGIDVVNVGGEPVIRSNVVAHNLGSGISLYKRPVYIPPAVGGFIVSENTIFANGGDGVAIGVITRNVIRMNSIDENGGLGINLLRGGIYGLDDDGVTPNDPGDADTGSNMLQNYPVLTDAVASAGQTAVNGTLDSTPNTSFTIDFYASAAPDPSGFGEGERHLGMVAVMTDATGHAVIAASMPAVNAGEVITATATEPLSGTSEFSNAITVLSPGTLQFSSATFAGAEGSTATITVTRTGGTFGTVTVDYTITPGTATAGSDYIATNGTLTFLDGQATATFTVNLVADSASEGPETIVLTLSNATGGAAIGSPSQAILTASDVSAIPALGQFAAIALAFLLALVALRSLHF